MKPAALAIILLPSLSFGYPSRTYPGVDTKTFLLASAQGPEGPLPALPTDLQPPSAPEPVAVPGWVNIHSFGEGRWKLGLDASASVGACLERELHDGQFLAGPCRDALVLAKDGKPAFHLGAAVLYNAEHGNATYQARLGFNVGPAAQAALAKTAYYIPALDSILNWKAPPWLSKIGDATTVDFAGGYRPIHDASVNGNWTYGVMVKADVPLDVVFGWLKSGL